MTDINTTDIPVAEKQEANAGVAENSQPTGEDLNLSTAQVELTGDITTSTIAQEVAEQPVLSPAPEQTQTEENSDESATGCPELSEQENKVIAHHGGLYTLLRELDGIGEESFDFVSEELKAAARHFSEAFIAIRKHLEKK